MGAPHELGRSRDVTAARQLGVPMSFERQVKFWLVALAVLVAALWLLSDILLPFIAGAALAYLLDPLVRRLDRFGINRAVSALAIIVLVIFAIVLIGIAIAPILSDQFSGFIDNLPGYVAKLQGMVSERGGAWLAKAFGGQGANASQTVGDLASQGAAWIATFLKSLWSGGKTLVSLLSLLVITPVVAFYLLCDWDRMIATVDSWVPLPNRERVRGLFREIDATVSAFVRGQAGVCVTLGAFYAAGMSLVGLNFGFLIGFIAGLISFIPYVGSITGLFVATAVALTQFLPEWTPVLMVVGVFLVGQGLEGYVLSPLLVGAKVGLHPVWVMFALLAFGYLFGFAGLLVAIPVSAAIGVLTRFALTRYMASPIYTGAEPR
jgi:predicted PurR-regulated permease PerM